MRRIFLVTLLCVGCTNFEPGTVIDSLRVLDIVTEPAEVASNMTAVATPLVIDPTAAYDGGALSYDAGMTIYEWAVCNLLPPTGQDISDDCFDDDMGTGIIQLPTMADGSTVMTMPPHTIMDLGLPDSTGGLYVPLRLRLTAGGVTITAFQKVRWANGLQPPNQNPTMMAISYVPTAMDGQLPDMGQTVDPQVLSEGLPLLQLPRGGKLRFRATATPGSAEMYTTVSIDPTHPQNIMTTQVTELVRFFWYTSAGKLNEEVTGEAQPDSVLDTTKYTDAIDRNDGIVDLWVVAHDERGGSGWMHRQFQLTE